MQILTPTQIAFLKTFGSERVISRHFYLTGGTPLAAYYTGHRFSEDLDFFSEQEVDASEILAFLKKHQKKLGFKKIDMQNSFNRNLFFLHYPKEILKTEFTYFPFPRIEPGGLHEGVSVDSLLDIAVNKVFTIYQRTKARDYIDLYMICNVLDVSVEDLVKKARIKFDTYIDPLQLGAQFKRANEAEDMPRMIEDIPKKKWVLFFEQEAKKFKKNILR